MNNIRRGFTMIELIFVIVIIGILAAVAIPKLTVNRDKAVAIVCENDVGILLTELVTYYTDNGYFDTLANMSSLRTGTANTDSGIVEAGTTVPSPTVPVTYACNGESVFVITPTLSSYPDRKGITHNQFGLVTTNPGGQVTVPASIFVTDMTNKLQYKASPGFVISGD